MSEPYIGEIRMFGGSFAPVGWAFCSGQLLPISGNDALFNLIGTTYGGDGQETFALPDLRGRLPLHQGNSFVIGQQAGTESVTLITSQMPVHHHQLLGSTSPASASTPGSGRVLATTAATTIAPYGSDNPLTTLDPSSVGLVGGSQPHDNTQPYLCVSFIIALDGFYPSQT